MSISEDELREFLDKLREPVAFRAAIKDLVECHLEARSRKARTGSISAAAALNSIFEERGLKIVPIIPTQAMRYDWKRGVFRTFFERYIAMLKAAPDGHGSIR